MFLLLFLKDYFFKNDKLVCLLLGELISLLDVLEYFFTELDGSDFTESKSIQDFLGEGVLLIQYFLGFLLIKLLLLLLLHLKLLLNN